MLERSLNDYFYFNMNNKDADKLTIVLHSHVGDADLRTSRNYTNPEDDPNSRSKI